MPEPLRRVADLVLTLPRIDARLFVEVFQKVLGAPPPVAWDKDGADWTRYLLHTDFHAPLRLKLAPTEAIAYLRERCKARLAQVSAGTSPRLEELHGLGEARQVAEDLIADIAAARAGKIAWSAVDRGVLLVGSPGTGKTTLARAIARACEVKFIHASAAQWQSTGALDVHLRAIRESFAEARRYAPAILFLDEIDSIGNREQLSGSNAVYQTEVIIAVLEQLQGIDPEEPVMVIAATNYVEKVDPALRRAGRLDQVVTIPLPNVAGLEQIFTYHLKPYRQAKEVGRDVDTKLLAQLAFGLTGADVEFFVRGAARRARKARRGMTQADLVAEITRRPRRPDSVVRLTPEEMRRVAAHEAGHALIGLLSPRAAHEITFVSIVPRTNGSLGFTATVPPEGAVMTRREVLERLQMVLAGRAAEELVYGKDDVGLGAGGGMAERPRRRHAHRHAPGLYFRAWSRRQPALDRDPHAGSAEADRRAVAKRLPGDSGPAPASPPVARGHRDPARRAAGAERQRAQGVDSRCARNPGGRPRGRPGAQVRQALRQAPGATLGRAGRLTRISSAERSSRSGLLVSGGCTAQDRGSQPLALPHASKRIQVCRRIIPRTLLPAPRARINPLMPRSRPNRRSRARRSRTSSSTSSCRALKALQESLGRPGLFVVESRFERFPQDLSGGARQKLGDADK